MAFLTAIPLKMDEDFLELSARFMFLFPVIGALIGFFAGLYSFFTNYSLCARARRHIDDKIWGLWPPDDLAPQIWDNMNKLIKKFGLKLDIIYDDPPFSFAEKYSEIYFWNGTIN